MKRFLFVLPNLFVPHLHGLSTGGTVNDTVEQVVKRAGVSLHNGLSAVNQLLNLIPFFRGNDGFVTVLNDFPFFTRNDVINIGANPFLVRPKNEMSTFILRITHQAQRRCSATEFSLSGTYCDTTQDLLGYIPVIHII